MKRKRESLDDTKPLTDEMLRPLDIGLTEYIIYVLWRNSQKVIYEGMSSYHIFEEVTRLRIRWSQESITFSDPQVRWRLFELIVEKNIIPIYSDEKSFNTFKLTENAKKVIDKAVHERDRNANYSDRRIRTMFICDLTQTLLQ